jgi:hypothetical protein
VALARGSIFSNKQERWYFGFAVRAHCVGECRQDFERLCLTWHRLVLVSGASPAAAVIHAMISADPAAADEASMVRHRGHCGDPYGS